MEMIVLDRIESIFSGFYNSEQKKSFLEYIDNKYNGLVHLYINIFNKSKILEERFNKDICFFNDEEIDLFLLEYLSRYSYDNSYKFELIYRYVQWCEVNGIISPYNSWENVEPMRYRRLPIISEIYKRQMIKDPKDLQEKLDSVLFGTDRINFKHYFMRVIVYLIYLGFERNEIPFIEVSHVDKENRIIKFNNKVIQYDSYIEPYIEAITSDDLSDGINREYKKTKYLIKRVQRKDIKTEHVPEFYIQWTVSKFISMYNNDNKNNKIDWSINRIYDSGVFYRIYEKEGLYKKIGSETEDILKSYFTKYYSIVKLYKIIDNYNTWKEVFYPVSKR